ncbi:hypothetical protein MKX03_021834, partial [Papaver bracteatum]
MCVSLLFLHIRLVCTQDRPTKPFGNFFLCNAESYRNLFGDIPTGNNFSRVLVDCFIGNPSLCGFWLGSARRTSHPLER